MSTTVFSAPDAERAVQALHDLDGGEPLASLSRSLPDALNGSDEATRRYVADYRRLTGALLAAGRELRPDLIVQNGRALTFRDGAGRPADALVGVLENGSAEAPFTAWAGELAAHDAVALHLANRVRAILGFGVLPEPASPPRVDDDVAAQRFLRRVRFYLNHPETENPLRRIMDAFALSKTDAAKLFGVSRQAVDGWLAGGVPAERQEKVATLLALCDLLQRKLKADRLPGVARRPAEAYGGRTMLELIAADRHGELLAERPRQLRLAVRRLAPVAYGLTARRGGAYNRLAEPAWADPLDVGFARERGGRWNAPGSYGTLYLNGSVAVARAQTRHKLAAQPYGIEDLDEAEQHDLVDVDVPVGDYLDCVTEAGLEAVGLPAYRTRGRSGTRSAGRSGPRPGTSGARASRAGPRRRRTARSWRCSTPRRAAS